MICNHCGQDPEAPPSNWKLARQAKGLDCRGAAKAAGVSASLISRLENGCQISLVSAVKLAKVYGVTVEQMVPLPPATPAQVG